MMEAEHAKAKIAAILPNYNMADTLVFALQTLLNQTVSFSEIIVVDDASTDNSVAVIESFVQQHPQIRLIQHAKNQGVVGALNTGVQQTNADYIMLCAADDSYGSKVVEHAQNVIQKHPGVGIICGDAVVIRFDLSEPFYRRLPFPSHTYISPEQFAQMARKGYVGFNGGGGMLINRQAMMKAEMLQAATRWHCDWVLYFVVALRQGIFYVNDVFTTISMRKESYSEGKRNKAVQDQVMLDTMKVLNSKYPDLQKIFSEAGLLPHYAFRYIWLYWNDPIARQFVSGRMLWKTLVNNRLVVRIGRLFPYPVILGMRKFLRA